MTDIETLQTLFLHLSNNEPLFEHAKMSFDFLLYYIEEDEPQALDYLFRLRDICIKQSSETLAQEWFELYNNTLRLLAPHHFDSYMLYVESGREPKKRFYLPRRRILKPIADSMQDLYEEKLDLLCISLPPGIGKTQTAIFFLTWLVGKHPELATLGTGHATSLTDSMYKGVLSILTDPEYKYADIFPTSLVAHTNSKEGTIDVQKRKRYSSVTLKSAGQGFTGSTRAMKLLYCDDLVSGFEEAVSKDRLDKLWSLYTTDIKTRKLGNCGELHIATRWSVHDVIGRLEREFKDDPRARFIVVPALNEQGESNFDYDYGVGFTTHNYRQMQELMDDVSWRALYMNEPIEREGLLYSEDDFEWYYELPEGEPDAVISIVDTKDVGKDYAFAPVAYLYGDDVYIEDCVCDNNLPDVVDARLADLFLKHRVKQARFESNSAGGRVADKVDSLVKQKGGITHITKKWTQSNKETKIIVNSAWVKQHVKLKDKTVVNPRTPEEQEFAKEALKKSKGFNRDDYKRMLSFLFSYTQIGKNKNDDVPDGMAQLAEYVQSMARRTVEVFKRPF